MIDLQQLSALMGERVISSVSGKTLMIKKNIK